MLSIAQARSAKVEPQYRKAKAAQRLHGVVNHLVVHRPAKQRMRMADQSGMRRVRLALIQQRLQPSRGPIEEERFDSIGHNSFYQSADRKTKTYHRDTEKNLNH